MVPWLEDCARFDTDIHYPPSEQALTAADDADGLLCASARITAAHLARSYPLGIYPWYSEGDPVLWWTPSQRAVLFTEQFKLHNSLRKTLQRWQASGRMQIKIDTAFDAVLAQCANRAQGTWMSEPLQAAYRQWHRQGAVHSIETWLDGKLVGGFYGCGGVGLGRMFFGESMFSNLTDASKMALACFVQWFESQGADMLDCQQDTAHLLSLGARTISRASFEQLLNERITQPDIDWASAACNPDLDLLKTWVCPARFRNDSGHP